MNMRNTKALAHDFDCYGCSKQRRKLVKAVKKMSRRRNRRAVRIELNMVK